MLHVNEIGDLPSLNNTEHLALVTAIQQVSRLESPTPNVAVQCVFTLARLAGLTLVDSRGRALGPMDHPDINPAVGVVVEGADGD